jgi:hypothetical protein
MEKHGSRYETSLRRGQKHCSTNCRNAQAYAERTKPTKSPNEATCRTCGREFVSSRNDAQFCSNACRQKHYRYPKM